MRSLITQNKKQGGFALGEMLLAIAVVALVVGIGVAVYSTMRSGINADDQASKTIALASDIQKQYRNAGSYSAVSASDLNKLNLLQKPIKFDGTNVQDAWGNTMSLSGGTTTFAITIGGAINPLSKDECATVANRLGSGVAVNVNVGQAATLGSGATAGQVSGGNAFKTGTTINQTNLSTGCSETSPVIAVSFR